MTNFCSSSHKCKQCLLVTIAAASAAVAMSQSPSTFASASSPLHASLELEESQSSLPPRLPANNNKRRGRPLRRRMAAQSLRPSLQHGHDNSANANHSRPKQHALRTLQSSNSQNNLDDTLQQYALNSSDFNGTAYFPLISPFLPTADYSSARIINGEATPQDRFPYATSLIDEMGNHICGGTLIAPDIILTAGHCSGFFGLGQIGRYDIASVPQGGIGDADGDGAKDYDVLVVEEHVTHPSYGNVIMNDFAVAKLYGVSTVKPVRVNAATAIPFDDEFLTVMGWGVTEEGNSQSNSDVLRKVDVQYMTNVECDASSGYFEGDLVSYAGYIDDNMMCAWAEDQDACQGDSGGPLVLVGDEEDGSDDVQVGIVSWGLGCALSDFPGVYARLSEEFDWIKRMVCGYSVDPPAYFNCGTGDDGNGDGNDQEDVSATLLDVTVAMELDAFPEDTSWVLEFDPSVRRTAGATIEGTSFVPFGTYSAIQETIGATLQVSPLQSYRLTVLDRRGNGLNYSSKIRLCYGNLTGEECMNANASAIICEGSGNFGLSEEILCFVEETEVDTKRPTRKPTASPVQGTVSKIPTFAPFEVPLYFNTREPKEKPTNQPTDRSQFVASMPTGVPTTIAPSKAPTPVMVSASSNLDATKNSTSATNGTEVSLNETVGIEAQNASTDIEPAPSENASVPTVFNDTASDDNNSTIAENNADDTSEDDEIPLSSEETMSSRTNGARGGGKEITKTFIFSTYCVTALSTVYLLVCG
mmetsp:Transcript_12640/g.26728  ORF Transcript_12640/g.26728 Transcript_12640/m.26728 type:complete len:757 (+) Transcript_12640:261-2531(+)